jgi:uncharacterized membrane protein YtjA (UPF0391 family)
MLRWALIFLVIALILAVLGFGGMAGAFAEIAKILVWIFVIFFVGGLILHLFRGRVLLGRARDRPERLIRST